MLYVTSIDSEAAPALRTGPGAAVEHEASTWRAKWTLSVGVVPPPVATLQRTEAFHDLYEYVDRGHDSALAYPGGPSGTDLSAAADLRGTEAAGLMESRQHACLQEPLSAPRRETSDGPPAGFNEANGPTTVPAPPVHQLMRLTSVCPMACKILGQWLFFLHCQFQ